MQITADNLDNLAIGSDFLSAGGGEESTYTKMIARQQLKKNMVSFIELASLPSDALIVPISFMGCPTIECEKNSNISHFEKLIQKIENHHQQKIIAFLPLIIGGRVPLIPIFLSSYFDIPLIDGDCTGRCFSDLQMVSAKVYDIGQKTAFMATFTNNIFSIDYKNLFELEKYARQIVVHSGGMCTIVPFILTPEEAKRTLIHGTITQALTIGNIIEDTHSFDAVMAYTKGQFLGVGGIASIDYIGGAYHHFMMKIIIRNFETQKTWTIFMGNEYDLLFQNEDIVAEIPDIITLCDPETCRPILFPQLTVGRNVAVCTMKAPDIWYTEKGLALTRTHKFLTERGTLCVSA